MSTCVAFGLLILAAAIIIYTMIKNVLISAVIGVIGEVILVIIYVVKSSIFEGGIQKVLDVFNLSGHFDNFTSNIFDIKGIIFSFSDRSMLVPYNTVYSEETLELVGR